ncbi:branched-chain amino acid ABC transporter permease [Euzebya pacifica]|jgi:branched-chain amino acid transport system permease protein|uniref:branched-chain amino acid ABC transporter permease n=1 Tax=Euzebya pacifica TaxID=1608957 RepID=UPI0030FCB918
MDLGNVLIDGFRAAFGVEAVVFALAAIGLNIHFGYTGLLNFGQVGFMLVGAYGVAIMGRPCPDVAATQTAADQIGPCGQPLVVGVLVGILLAVILALLLGAPTLRLRSDYLAITTIAAAEILRFVFRSDVARPITNSVFGLQQFAGDFFAVNPFPDGPSDRYFGALNYSGQQLWVMVVGWALVGLLTFWTWSLMRSPWGRVLKSIREDEDAARALGKNVFSYKMQALILGGIFGALGGIFLAMGTQAVNPDTYIPVRTFFAYVIIILGGAGTIWGPIVGTFIFLFLTAGLDTLMRELIEGGIVSESIIATQEIGPIRFILVGLMLALLMAFRPQGIFGNKEEMLLDAR